MSISTDSRTSKLYKEFVYKVSMWLNDVIIDYVLWTNDVIITFEI